VNRIQTLIPDPPGRHQGAGVRSVIPKPSHNPEPSAKPGVGQDVLQEAARQVWEEHQRETQINAAREALIAAGMPADHPDADALTHRVLAVMEQHT